MNEKMAFIPTEPLIVYTSFLSSSVFSFTPALCSSPFVLFSLHFHLMCSPREDLNRVAQTFVCIKFGGRGERDQASECKEPNPLIKLFASVKKQLTFRQQASSSALPRPLLPLRSAPRKEQHKSSSLRIAGARFGWFCSVECAIPFLLGGSGQIKRKKFIVFGRVQPERSKRLYTQNAAMCCGKFVTRHNDEVLNLKFNPNPGVAFKWKWSVHVRGTRKSICSDEIMLFGHPFLFYRFSWVLVRTAENMFLHEYGAMTCRINLWAQNGLSVLVIFIFDSVTADTIFVKNQYI